ncbi:hypothetical protein [Nakamurella endophytica]|uniref:Uncharacterized protein n=1 Tax=Nakamurella endophytica TaxID=1748367 RepID=A0A917SMX3_9ACTN|nr:hypothetical protein [Nakamurella endophytica]GGL89922.1 hypothetical protein GCM10011594_06990 [Nakamurella endophytica]
MILGYLLAVCGALGSGIGSVLESIGVRRSGAFGGGTDELGRVARQPLYWCGILVDIAGFVCAAAALHHLPLFLVQSVMAFSVGVTATISVLLGSHLHRWGWTSLGVAAAGLVLVGISAEPGAARPLPPGWHWFLLGLVAPGLVIAYGASRTDRWWTAPTLAFGAGMGFAAVAVSARTLHVHSLGGLIGSPAAWAIAVNGVAATVVFAMALQKGSPTTVSAVMFTTNTVAPSLVGLLVLGDRIRPGFAVAGGIGFVMAVVGAIALAHYASMSPPPGPTERRANRPLTARA